MNPPISLPLIYTQQQVLQTFARTGWLLGGLGRRYQWHSAQALGALSAAPLCIGIKVIMQCIYMLSVQFTVVLGKHFHGTSEL